MYICTIKDNRVALIQQYHCRATCMAKRKRVKQT